jgi:hypothetical protein
VGGPPEGEGAFAPKTLIGEFDPSLEEALREASKIVCAELVNTVKKIQEGKR